MYFIRWARLGVGMCWSLEWGLEVLHGYLGSWGCYISIQMLGKLFCFCSHLGNITPLDNPYSFISLLLILLCSLAWLYACKFHIWLPISVHVLLEWFMVLTLFVQLTYINALQWIVGLYYHGSLVIEGIGLIKVIQTFYLSALNVLYHTDVYPTPSIVWSTHVCT